MKLEDFMKKNKPLKKVSVLEPFQAEIKTLLKNDYTQEQILEFLKLSKNIQVSRQSLSKFLKKNLDKKPYSQPEPQSKIEEAQAVEQEPQDEKEAQNAKVAAFAKKMGVNFKS